MLTLVYLHFLLNKVITNPFYKHIALTRSHGLIIDSYYQSLFGLLDGNTSRALL